MSILLVSPRKANSLSGWLASPWPLIFTPWPALGTAVAERDETSLEIFTASATSGRTESTDFAALYLLCLLRLYVCAAEQKQSVLFQGQVCRIGFQLSTLSVKPCRLSSKH